MRALSFLLYVLFVTNAQAEISPYQKQAEVANSVGLRLIKEATTHQLTTKGELKNTMVSGVSAYAALSLLAGGVQGQTATGMNQYLNIQDLTAFDMDSSGYLGFLSREPGSSKKSFATMPTIGIYNSAWASNGKSTGRPYHFSKPFASRLKSLYASDISDGEFDFKDQKAVDAINRWADAKTNHLIPEILDADTLSELVWVLMNATYFEGEWGVRFHQLAAQYAPKFTGLNGKPKAVDSIATISELAYIKNANYEGVQIPFVGQDLSFVVIQPHSQAIYKELISQGSAFTANFWTGVLSELSKDENTQQVQLTMPKFTFDYTVEMKRDEPLTKAVGLNFLFADSGEGFIPMATRESPLTAVGLIKQSSKIELDEKGVKAAAVTAIGGMERSAIIQQPQVVMKVDRPFVFAIVEKKTQTLLFVGTLTQP